MSTTAAQSAGRRKLILFSVGQDVRVKNYWGGEKWLNGVITDVLGPVTFMVSVNGAYVKRHVNQMLASKSDRREQTEIYTDVYSDYHGDSEEDWGDTETVTGDTGKNQKKHLMKTKAQRD